MNLHENILISINKVLNNIYVTLRHINMHEFSLNTLTCFNNAN